MSIYKRYRFSPDVIQFAVWDYFKFSLSLRDVEDLLAERGIEVSRESIRAWCLKFGRIYQKRLRSKAEAFGDAWFVDEVFINIKGERHTYGERSIKTATLLMFSCKSDATPRRLSAFSDGYLGRTSKSGQGRLLRTSLEATAWHIARYLLMLSMIRSNIITTDRSPLMSLREFESARCGDLNRGTKHSIS